MELDSRDNRPDPDALIAAAAREGRGRLKVFLGAAPGVGKTWEMLAAGRHRRAEGVDVVIGVVETHGRAQTEAQIGDLPVLPRHAVPYRGQTIDEFDLDAALARRPGLLLVDELAHTNAPGSRHHKRWEDVAELLDAGIDVWATLNVQHLESLNDAVARITGVRVRETLPDRVLEMADEIELIDLPPNELRKRLEQGLVYRADVAQRAMEGFFREGNLAALREMALRRAAERVDADVTDYMRARAIAGPWPAGERVLALIGPDPAAEAVVRQARRLADALRAPWIALHVERGAADAEARGPMAMAAQLGAEIEVASGNDLVAAILDVARKRNVTQIVVGRARAPLWRRMLRRSLSLALLRRADAFAVHVVPSPTGMEPARPRRRIPEPITAWAGATLLVAAMVGVGEGLVRFVSQETLGMVFLAAVVAAATLWGLRIAVFAAVLSFMAWNFFFIPPLYKLTIYEPRDAIAIVLFLGVATATGALASRVRRDALAARSRIEGLRRIGAFSRSLGEPTTEHELLAEIARQGAGLCGSALVLTAQGEDLNIRAAEPPADTMDDAAWAAARWTFAKQEPAGRGTGTMPSVQWRFLSMRTVRGQVGVLGVKPGRDLDQPVLQAVAALADQGAVAIERVRLATEAARSEAQAETQKLRTALLSSLSHDLRTPLAGILGAAGTLRAAWTALDDATREDLLRSIEEDTSRMNRFLSNIMEMTRLETGEIVPRLAPVSPHDAIQAAVARLPKPPPIFYDIPVDLPDVTADPMLLEQVLVNVLDNAVKYAGAESPIDISAHVTGAQSAAARVVLRIADRGMGIAPEHLPHVFDSFYRARLGDRVAPGMGLGLAIARGLMEAMGGSIDAESPRPGVREGEAPGTVITLRLPVAV
ncbi:MAG: sensor histidine kinase KdpD [Proteobacteria bacterium]|nr:sensor histidine kinase KdpD [Pseudomonadota bacterium]